MGENSVNMGEKIAWRIFELEKEWRFIIHQKRQYM